MFPRHKRLGRAAFPAVRSSRRIASKNFSVTLPEGARGYAVVVSKKVALRATKRNRIKRRTLAALRSLSLPPALILFPKASAGGLMYVEIREELAELLSKIKK